MQNMRLEDKEIAEHGDEGQGDRLMQAKRYVPSGPEAAVAGALANTLLAFCDKRCMRLFAMQMRRRSKPRANMNPDTPQLQASSSMSERVPVGGTASSLRRASATGTVPDELTEPPRLEVMLRSKLVGHLLTPLAAAASPGRKLPGNTCHIPAAGSPSGMYVASTSMPSSNRSRNDV